MTSSTGAKVAKSISAVPLKLLTALLIASISFGCAHGKIPVIYDQVPNEPYDVIGKVQTHVEWHGLQWFWFWWHYMPGYSPIYKIHEKALIKEARKLNADAIINVKQLPHRAGATGEAIRFK